MGSINKDRLSLVQHLGGFSTDFLLHWARKITDMLWTDFVIVVKDNPKLQEFFDDIQQSQNLLSFFKQIEIECFLFGKSTPMWEILITDEGRYLLFDRLIPSKQTNTMFIGNDQNTEYLAVGWRNFANGDGAKSQLTLFQAFTKNEIYSAPMGANTFGKTLFNGFVTTTTPDYIYQLATNTIKVETRYENLPVTTIFNRKEFQSYHNSMLIPSDNRTSFSSTENFVNYKTPLESDTAYLTDWYPIKDWLPILDYIGTFLGYELVVNSTKLIGNFDLNAFNEGFTKVFRQQFPEVSNENALLAASAIVKTEIAGAGSKAEQMTSEFKGIEWVSFMNNLIDLMERICGFGSTKSGSAGVYEPIPKMAEKQTDADIFLGQRAKERAKQIKLQILDRLVATFFSDDEIGDDYEFRIVPQNFKEEFDNIERVQMLSALGAIDKGTMLNTVHKDKTNFEREQIANKVSAEEASLATVQGFDEIGEDEYRDPEPEFKGKNKFAADKEGK